MSVKIFWCIKTWEKWSYTGLEDCLSMSCTLYLFKEQTHYSHKYLYMLLDFLMLKKSVSLPGSYWKDGKISHNKKTISSLRSFCNFHWVSITFVWMFITISTMILISLKLNCSKWFEKKTGRGRNKIFNLFWKQIAKEENIYLISWDWLIDPGIILEWHKRIIFLVHNYTVFIRIEMLNSFSYKFGCI